MRWIYAAVVVVVLGGCATPSTNMRIGNEQSYTSLQYQRESALAVAEHIDMPAGAVQIGPVDASRCHRFQGDIEPGKEILMADLKAAAYARGADGIYGAAVVAESGLLRNCWHIITARAIMFKLTR
jgi:hypothetical protein